MSTLEKRKSSGLVSRRSVGAAIVGGSVGLIYANAQAAQSERFIGGSMEDQMQIEQLIYQYAMAIDGRDAELMAQCLAPNATLEAGAADGTRWHLKGNFAAELIGKVRRAYELASVEFSLHHMLNRLYSIDGNVATGVTYCFCVSFRNVDGKRMRTEQHIRYRDEIVKQDGRWLFLKRKYEPLYRTEAVSVKKYDESKDVFV